MDAVGECEQDAFWLFCAIVEGVLRDYYSLTLYGVRRDTMVLAAALRRLRPELAAHLDRCVHQALCVKIDFRPPPMFCMGESQFPSEQISVRDWLQACRGVSHGSGERASDHDGDDGDGVRSECFPPEYPFLCVHRISVWRILTGGVFLLETLTIGTPGPLDERRSHRGGAKQGNPTPSNNHSAHRLGFHIRARSFGFCFDEN